MALTLVCAGVAAQPGATDLTVTLTPVEAPFQAPDFKLRDMDGNDRSLGEFRGKVVLLNLWATWCPPCRKEMPSMERLYQKLKGEGAPFEVLAVNQWESPDHVFSYLGQLEVLPSFPILFDSESRVADALGVKGLPTSFLLGKDGRVVYRAVGGRELDHPSIEQVVRALLAEGP
jgi:thiol-disulfide isomerase/thioredoxin